MVSVRTACPMDIPAAKGRTRTPSISSDSSDGEINFTGCENARKILEVLRGGKSLCVKKRGDVSAKGSAECPIANGAELCHVTSAHHDDDVDEKTSLGITLQYSSDARYDSDFVKYDRNVAANDPFGTPPKEGFKEPSSTGTPSDKAHEKWHSGDSSRSSCSDKIEDDGVVVHDKDDKDDDDKITPVRGPKGPIVSSENAQAIYPPSACVFVANLLQTEDELQLKVAVTQVFREYGVVFVKIRRDSKNMPFAFCQYTNDKDAAKAVLYGKGRLIHGRPCRTEKAKARRTFYISRRIMPAITEEEARSLLGKFGEIERLWVPEKDELAQLELDEDGFFAQFTFFESGREAIVACRDHGTYYLKPIDNKGTPQEESETQRKKFEDQQLETWLDRYGQDTRSVFVGNIPQRYTEDHLRKLFSNYGDIIHVSLYRNHSCRPGIEYNVFGFIEFDSPGSAQRAIVGKHGVLIDGEFLKVVSKNSEHRLSAIRRPVEINRTPRQDDKTQQPVATPMGPSNVAGYPYGYPTPFSSPFGTYLPYYPHCPPYWNGSPLSTSPPGAFYGPFGYPDFTYYQPTPVYFHTPPAGDNNTTNGHVDEIIIDETEKTESETH